MAAIVGGNGLGLNLGSLAALGRRGLLGQATQGRNGERAYVNVSTGSLVLQDQDLALVGRGPDAGVLRTYNSGGTFDFDNGDGWIGAPYKSVQRVDGSTLRRTDSDGSTCDYVLDEARQLYVATASPGSAVDTLAVNQDGTYTWTDGATGTKEVYEGAGRGLILSETDTSGNGLGYQYDGQGLLQSVTTSSGEVVTYTYEGQQLKEVSTALGTGEVLRQVSYGYDVQGRLETVKVTLDPGGDLPTGSETLSVYETRYGYDGTSSRVASATQSDGTSLGFTYVLVDGNYRVETVTDGNGKVTRFGYDLTSRATTVTDGLGLSTVYGYDAKGQLTEIRGGVTPTNTVGLTRVAYGYNALGDVTSITDGLGHAVVMDYDGNGNLTTQVDSLGNRVERTYTAQNQVETETVYPAAGQPETARNVYDAGGRNLLRFVVSAEGGVTEYRYNGWGQRTSAVAYPAARFDASGLGPTEVPTEGELEVWAAAQDASWTARTDMAYDFRGQLQTLTSYAAVGADGEGVVGTATTEHYVYDQRGLLLETISPDARTETHSIYDGFGRVVSTVVSAADATLSATTVTQYDDANGKTTVTLANGLATTSAYDHAGRLTSVVQTASGGELGRTTYAYDAAGRLLMTKDPTGQRRFAIYDAAGRKVGDVDGAGGLTEYVYDAAGQVTEVIGYATAVSIGSLVNGEVPTGATLESIRPGANSKEPKGWSFYDEAGRLEWQVDALGYVTRTEYDGASRVQSVMRLGTAVNPSLLGDGKGVTLSFESGPATVQVARSEDDRTTTSIRDRDSRLRATVDGEGYLTEIRYDGAGRPVQTIAYATKLALFTDAASIEARVDAARATGSLAGILPSADPAADVSTFTYYNARGQKVGEVDGEGYLTELIYDANGRLAETTRYDVKARGPVTADATLASLRPTPSVEDQTGSRTYDGLGRLSTETNAEGTVTRYAYDAVGNLVETTAALDTSERRTALARYDVQGRVTAELSAEGAALLTGNETAEQIEGIWNQYGTRYTYDGAGRRTSATDANGNRTVYYYDDVGRLRFTVNALGEVSERQYDVLGRVKSTTQHARTIGATTLAGFQGGLLSSTANQAAAQALVASSFGSADDSIVAFEYDARGQVTKSTDAMLGSAEASYDAFGEVTSTRQSIDGTHELVATQVYDRRGLRTSSVSDAGDATHVNASTSAEYDAFGRLFRSVDANGNAREQHFDRLGRVVETIDPTSALRGTTYDAFGRVFTQTDALGNVTQYHYDTASRSITVTTPEGLSVTTVRNRYGQALTVTDLRGNVTTYGYDRRGNVVSVSRTVDGATSVETGSGYDRAGRLVETTDANGNVVAYGYDAANRLLSRTVDPGGLSLRTTYGYDAKGQQVRVTDPNGIVTDSAFDLNGRLKTQTVDVGVSGLNLATVYSYDELGRVLTVTSPGGTITKHVYDALGRRTDTIVDPAGLTLATSYEYDQSGNVVSSKDPAGNVSRYVYDAAGRVVYTVDGAGGVRRNDYDAEGRVVATTVYATPISLDGLGTAVSGEAITSRIQPAASGRPDIVELRVYDRDGRVTDAIDGEGGVTRYGYDASGNVVERRTYAKRIVLADWNRSLDPRPPVVDDDARDLRVRTVYDGLNRAIYTIDGVGAVVEQRYDGNGNVVERFAYAERIPAGTVATPEAVAAALLLVKDGAHDAHIRREYDAANRLAWSVDGTGAVTEQIFDGDGNLVKQVAYGRTIAEGAAPTSVQASSADRVKLLTYDRAGRLVYQVDAQGAVNELVYDRNGNVVQRFAYATPMAAPTATTAPVPLTANVWNIVRSSGGGTRTSRAVYDAASRMRYAVDSTGAVTENHYDGAGHLVATLAYANLIAPGSAPVIGAGGQVTGLPATSGDDRLELSAYDAVGRLVYGVDALGYVTQKEYDGAGRVITATLHAGQTTGLGIGASRADIAAAVGAPTAADQGSAFAYDAAGNLVGSTDAIGGTENYAYNGAGEKVSFKNKNDAVWRYDYDAAGKLVEETAPAVDLTAVVFNAETSRYESMMTPRANVVTRLEYDALGNVTKRIEAAGRPEERVTTYAYDVMGRQVKTTFAPVSVYEESDTALAANGATSPATRAETAPIAHSSEVFYDSFGDAVANVDVVGSRSYKTYDSLGRVQYEVDALGYVTGYERNSFGEVVKLTRYAERPVLNASEAAPPTVEQIAEALEKVAHDTDRSITTSYDAMGRAVQVVQPTAWVDLGNGVVGNYAATTQHVYDAFGEAVKTYVLADPIAGTYACTARRYDQRGQEIATVDALGYATVQEYDAAGNLTRRLEYATALPGMTVNGRTVYDLPAATRVADDREVVWTYDRANRKTTETRKQVEYTDAAGVTARRDLTTQYGYDAVGNVTSTVDVLGATYTYYDALGRTRAVVSPWVGGASGATIRPLTRFGRDALGNVVSKTEYANGAEGTSELPGSADPAADRVTLTRYDARGNAIEVIDALGISHDMSYDAAGRLAKQWQRVTGNGVTRTLFTAFRYDALGRETAMITPASTSIVSGGTIQTVSQAQAGVVTTAMAYNGFGELVQRSTAATGQVLRPDEIEFFDYDAAGQLWRTNSGDGIVKVLLYDLLGNQSAQITSDGTIDLRSLASPERVDMKGQGQITVTNHFWSSRIEQIQFSDGVIWDDRTVKSFTTNGTAGNDNFTGFSDAQNRLNGVGGNDTLTGGALADVLDGGVGDDTLRGDGGDDELIGGEGDDSLSGYTGNDVLDGGVGNDSLDGGTGDDTYVFRKGSGVDKISDYDASGAGNKDTIQFLDVVSAEVTSVEQRGNDLVVKYGAGDQVTVASYFWLVGCRIEQIQFADGVTWDDATLKSVMRNGTKGNDSLIAFNDAPSRMNGLGGNDTVTGGGLADVLDGGVGDDTLSGMSGDDQLVGGEGNDSLSGGAGIDVLDGGVGNDALDGGAGNDTYVLRKGSGVDTISDNDATVGNKDTIQFLDVASTEVTALERKGWDLVVKYGVGDQVTVAAYFSASQYRIEQIQFSDGVVWGDQTVRSLATNGTAGNDTFTGFSDVQNRMSGAGGNDSLTGGALADVIDGGTGDDLLNGAAGDDTLLGGEGDDSLSDATGNDLLDGGVGNDALDGGVGNDTYVFRKGSGVDKITDSDTRV